MATNRPARKSSSGTNTGSDAIKIVESEVTKSQTIARLITDGVLSVATLKQYGGGGDDLDVSDLVIEMKKAGDEVVAGEMGRIERMLANQLLTLDSLFNNLAQRSGRQESFKGIEVLMRLALKAQAQARATAETLAVIKNPMPYIKQANIAHGHQQVNNGTRPDQYAQARAENTFSEPNKLLEAEHGERMDTRAQAAAGRDDQDVEAVGAVHRSQVSKG
jgi:hypothetical protein